MTTDERLPRLRWFAVLTLIAIALYFLRDCEPVKDDPVIAALEKRIADDEIKLSAARDSIKALMDRQPEIKREIVYIKVKGKAEAEKADTFTTGEVAEYLGNRYGTIGIEQQAEAVALKDTVSRQVVKDLILGDYCATELSLTNDLVRNLEQSQEQHQNALEVLQRQKSDQGLIIDSQKAENRKVRNQRDLWKILTVISGCAGFAIGNSL